MLYIMTTSHLQVVMQPVATAGRFNASANAGSTSGELKQ
jgi:hypothetical protein